MDSVRWIIQYLCCLSFCLSTISCFISVQDEHECSTERAELLQHEPNWISRLNNSEYCFVNECTIRLKESNVLLSIISNKTTDWITATNSTNLFTLVLVDSGYCSRLEDPKIGNFIFIVVISFIIVSSSSLNIVLHLTIKELRSYHARCYNYWNMWHSNYIVPLRNDYSCIPVRLYIQWEFNNLCSV